MHRTSCTRCLIYCSPTRRLPRQLRLLWLGAPSRSRPQLCRPQLHPRQLAGGALDQVIDIVASRRRRRTLPPHVHQHDHSSALGRRYADRAEKVGRARQTRAGIDSVQSDDHDAAGRAGTQRHWRRDLHRRAGRLQPRGIRSYPRLRRAVPAQLGQILGNSPCRGRDIRDQSGLARI